jgi:pimeloyl-ACP methyl ester carboxylesterase
MFENTTEELSFESVADVAVAVAFHHAASRRVVVMAHGFHGNRVGGSRHFVDLARELARRGIGSLRFDQPGSGDSSGSFEDASFDTWVATIEHFARRLHADGYEVALLGESMGGTATMAAAAKLGRDICGVALWSPDPLLSADEPLPEDGWMEEAGQRVRWDYWREARARDFLEAYRRVVVPAYIVWGTADHVVPLAHVRHFESQRKPGDEIRVIEGLPHSAWPVNRWAEILQETAEFLSSAFSQL